MDFKFKPIGSVKQEQFNIGTSAEIAEARIESQKMLNEINNFIEKEGLIRKKYVDDIGVEREGLFRADNAEVPIIQMWTYTEDDLSYLNPEEQRELKSFWERFKIKFKDYSAESTIEDKFGEFF